MAVTTYLDIPLNHNIMFYNKAYTSGGALYNDTTAGITANTKWYIKRADGAPIDSVVASDGSMEYIYEKWSDFSISRYNEQLFLDLGLAVTLVNPAPAATLYSQPVYVSTPLSDNLVVANYADNVYKYYNGFVSAGALLNSQMTFANNELIWLSGIPDNDSYITIGFVPVRSMLQVHIIRSVEALLHTRYLNLILMKTTSKCLMPKYMVLAPFRKVLTRIRLWRMLSEVYGVRMHWSPLCLSIQVSTIRTTCLKIVSLTVLNLTRTVFNVI